MHQYLFMSLFLVLHYIPTEKLSRKLLSKGGFKGWGDPLKEVFVKTFHRKLSEISFVKESTTSSTPLAMTCLGPGVFGLQGCISLVSR